MKRCNRFLKTIQKRVYDFLSHKYALFFSITSLIAILILVLQLSDTIIEYNLLNSKNISQQASQSIDVVYTWVNGSDVEHLKQIKSFKTAQKKPDQVEFRNFLQLKNHSWPCHHKLCIQTNNLIVAVPKLDSEDKQKLLHISKSKLDETEYAELQIESNKNISIIYTNPNQTTLQKLGFVLHNFDSKYKFYVAYYTIDCSNSVNCVHNVHRTFISKQVKTVQTNSISSTFNLMNFNLPGVETNSIELPKNISENLIYKFDYVYKPPEFYDGTTNDDKNKKSSYLNSKSGLLLSIFKVKNKEIDSFIKKHVNNSEMSFRSRYDRVVALDFYSAHIVWDLGDPFYEDVSENRFYDNDELKYSLRSLEQNADWVRHVYLVTNGQVPIWLNQSHPKLKLINHSEIFLNKSHLPTFSSPAIETHLHRIKGISDKFLYFNDDVLLGNKIYPDDFYTQSKGFRLYLAWSLPGCNHACPNSWIRDGYCDKSCNTTECDFDGGDCDQKKQSYFDTARQAFLNQSNLIFPEFYCSHGCSTSWLADKYCDHACNNPACAYDMGDCGLSNFANNLYEVKLDQLKSLHLDIPSKIDSFYLNFSKPINISSAFYEQNLNVRQISIINKLGLINVLLMPHNYRLKLNQHKKLTIKIENFYLSFNLDSFNQTSTTSTYFHKTKTFELKKLIQIKDTAPKLIFESQNVELKQNKFDNKLVQNIYENYIKYLNWSLSNEFLSHKGYNYKLNLFQNQNLLENLDKYLIGDDDLQKEFNFLFKNDIKFMNEFEKSVLLDQYINETRSDSNMFQQFKKRKLLDTFADSLKHVNRLFNRIYGYNARKVPAHMPHLIDKSIVLELQTKFEWEFEQTSSNRFRASTDMQYSFSYYYYIMSEMEQFDISKLFDELDSNKNGVLDQAEIMLINIRLNSKPFSDETEVNTIKPELLENLNTCLNQTNSNKIYKKHFQQCKNLIEFLKSKFWNEERKKFKYETVGDEDIKFIMISGDPIDVEIKLNNLLREPKKFMCLNDNIDYKLVNEAKKLKELVKYFYEMLYPVKSSFELEENYKPRLDTSLDSTRFIEIIFKVLILIGFVFILKLVYELLFYSRRLRANSRKEKIKKSKREYKASSLLRQKIELESSSSSSSSSCLSLNEADTSIAVNSNSFTTIMRSKFKNLKPNKSKKTANIKNI